MVGVVVNEGGDLDAPQPGLGGDDVEVQQVLYGFTTLCGKLAGQQVLCRVQLVLGHLRHGLESLDERLLPLGDLGDLEVGVGRAVLVPVHAPVEGGPGGGEGELVGDEPVDVADQGVVEGEGQDELGEDLVRVQGDRALADVLHHGERQVLQPQGDDGQVEEVDAQGGALCGLEHPQEGSRAQDAFVDGLREAVHHARGIETPLRTHHVAQNRSTPTDKR